MIVTASDAERIHRKSLGLAFRGLWFESPLVPELFLWIEILSLSITNSLVPRPDPPEKEGPGIHCLRMRLISQNLGKIVDYRVISVQL